MDTQAIWHLHMQEEGQENVDNTVHLRVQQWSVFDDVGLRIPWWRTQGAYKDPPDKEDRGDP